MNPLKDDRTKETILHLANKGYNQEEIATLILGRASAKSTIGDFLRGATCQDWWDAKLNPPGREDVGLKIVFIPDPQVKPGCPMEHLVAAGNYCAVHRPDVIVAAGD